MLELNESGAEISYEEYYPYGSTAYQAERSAAEVGLKRYRYTGKEKDEESGFYYHGARYYVCWLGRWVSPDPIGIQDEGLNLYKYVLNNPITFYDSSGNKAQSGIFSEVVRGDFHKDKTTWWGALINTGIGLIPFVGQAADLRDTTAAAKGVWNKPGSWSSWGGLGLAAVGWFPGVGDVVKGAFRVGAKAGTHVAKRVVPDSIKQLAKSGKKLVEEQLMQERIK